MGDDTYPLIKDNWPKKFESGTANFRAPVILPDKMSPANEGSRIATRPIPTPSTPSRVEITMSYRVS